MGQGPSGLGKECFAYEEISISVILELGEIRAWAVSSKGPRANLRRPGGNAESEWIMVIKTFYPHPLNDCLVVHCSLMQVLIDSSV